MFINVSNFAENIMLNKLIGIVLDCTSIEQVSLKIHVLQWY